MRKRRVFGSIRIAVGSRNSGSEGELMSRVVSRTRIMPVATVGEGQITNEGR